MIQQQEYDQLRDEIRRLRDEQEKLRREAPSNGHKSQEAAQDSGKPRPESSNDQQQGKDEKRPDQKGPDKADEPSNKEKEHNLSRRSRNEFAPISRSIENKSLSAPSFSLSRPFSRSFY